MLLPKGVYLQNNSPNDKIARLDKCEAHNVDKLLKKIRESGSFLQRGRTKSIIKVILRKFGKEVKLQEQELDSESMQQQEDTSENDLLETQADDQKDSSIKHDIWLAENASWRNIPYLRTNKNDTAYTVKVNNSILELKKEIASNKPSINKRKQDLKKAAEQYIRHHKHPIQSNTRTKKQICVIYKTRIDKND